MNLNKLAVEVVTEHLGDVVGRVARTLVDRGRLLFADIVRFSQESVAHVRSALLVLLHHNLVDVVMEDPPGGRGGENVGLLVRQKVYVYHADVDAMVLRLRFPRYVLHAREVFGERGERLISELLDHGRVTVDGVCQQSVSLTIENEDERRMEMEEFKKTFGVLVAGEYVVPVPRVDRRVVSVKEERTKTPSTRGRKRALEGEDEPQSPSKRRGKRSSMEEIELTEATRPSLALPGDEVLWRVNVDRFHKDMRHKVCADIITKKIGAVEGRIIAALLRHTVGSEATARERTSALVRVDSILPLLREEFQDLNLPDDTLCSMLCKITEDSIHPLRLVGEERSGCYIVGIHPFTIPNPLCTVLLDDLLDMGNIISFAQQKQIESVIVHQFDEQALRIFRLLQEKKQLEQKQIADMAMIPFKDARDRLYRMLSHEYVALQEISKSAEYAAARTFFLFSANIHPLTLRLMDDIYRTIRNLRIRSQFEKQRLKEMIEAGNVHSKEQRSKLFRQRAIIDRLEASALRVDEMIILFRSFI